MPQTAKYVSSPSKLGRVGLLCVIRPDRLIYQVLIGRHLCKLAVTVSSILSKLVVLHRSAGPEPEDSEGEG